MSARKPKAASRPGSNQDIEKSKLIRLAFWSFTSLLGAIVGYRELRPETAFVAAFLFPHMLNKAKDCWVYFSRGPLHQNPQRGFSAFFPCALFLFAFLAYFLGPNTAERPLDFKLGPVIGAGMACASIFYGLVMARWIHPK